MHVRHRISSIGTQVVHSCVHTDRLWPVLRVSPKFLKDLLQSVWFWADALDSGAEIPVVMAHETPDCRRIWRHLSTAGAARMTTERRGSALGALANAGGEFLDMVENLAAVRHLVENLALGVHHRGVITTERLPDFG